MESIKYKVFVWNDVISPSRDYDLETKLNVMASQGWELHSAIPQTEEGTTQYTVFVFKKVE